MVEISHDTAVMIVTAIAAFFTTIAFVPQAVLVIRTKRTYDISLWMYVMDTVGMVFWLYLGMMYANWVMVATDVLIRLGVIKLSCQCVRLSSRC